MQNLSTHQANAKELSVVTYTNEQAVKFKTEIGFKTAQISGITIVKRRGDMLSGAFVNEFGIKGFEFKIYNGKCELNNIMRQLNKWYIRNTLANDLLYIFGVFYTRNPSDKVEIALSRSKIFEYTLKNERIASSSRKENAKTTGALTVENPLNFKAKNTKSGITYTFQLIE